jgi:hypothetical protein
MAIDGIGGSAFAGFNYCWIQPRMATPKAQWSLDAAKPVISTPIGSACRRAQVD